MDIEERINLIMRDPTIEVVTYDELKLIFETVSYPKHYIGLEISGMLHLGSLVLTGFKINDFIKAKVHSTVFLADWHTFINNKLDRNWEKIRELSNYYYDAFKFFCPEVQIVLGSKLYENTNDYWENFIRFSKHMTLSRTMRSLAIMGRTQSERLDFSQLIYPLMQAVDIKALDLDIVHAGMDQRKIHMLVREIFPKLGWKVPISVHHSLLPGLSEPTILGLAGEKSEDIKISSKMSKSKPDSGITIHDTEKIIEDKVYKAFCPVYPENNPILSLVRFIIFHQFSEFVIERPSRFGGNISYMNYNDVERDYLKKKIHPLDLKKATAVYINRIIQPIRDHFSDKIPNFND
jgi:tyrosyl-tRNA synthetase